MPVASVPGTPDNASAAAKRRGPPEPIAGAATKSGAIRTLRLLVVGAIVVPLLLGAVAGYLSYRASYQRAAAALAEAAAVAEENTTKVLDTHMLVAARIDDLLAGMPDDAVRAREQELHERIAGQIENLPQVAAAWVIDATGHELVSARVYPVNHELDQSGRDDFRALRDGKAQTFIWALRARSLNGGEYQPYFEVSRRRDGADGGFGGIIVVAVSGDYFASFFNSLLGSSAQYTASVVREDGSILAYYPQVATSPPPADDLLAQAIAARGTSGIIASYQPSGHGRVVAYRRLANYPVYVAVGRTQGAIINEWLQSVIGYAVVGLAAAVGFLLLSLLALHRTRREQQALAQARDATIQRAAIETQLHQAQKLEAVGLLTAGIAHDFNNLLTIVAGNIALLEASSGAADARSRRYVGAATEACERATALTRRLLGFARREPIDPRPVDVNEVIASVADLPWRSLGDQIAAEFRLSNALWPVFVDPHQLENALLNLALNARDAMAGRGSLTIETRNCHVGKGDGAGEPGLPPGDYVAIFVHDTGAGMPPEIREKAFDPFFTTKEAGKGTGLGLSQVYGFVTRFGGYCAIDSEPGRGTTVKLYLPRYLGPRDEPAEAAEPAEALPAPPSGDQR